MKLYIIVGQISANLELKRASIYCSWIEMCGVWISFEIQYASILVFV